MRYIANKSWKVSPKGGKWNIVLPILAIVTLAPAAVAEEPDPEERRVVRNVLRLQDCPEVKVLGSGDVRVLSLSPHGFLGVETSNLTPELRRHFGVMEDTGIMLSRVLEDSAAQAAGLAVGDIITRVDGEEITTASRLGRAIRRRDGGESVEIEYWRRGEMQRANATLEERKPCSFDIGDTLREIDIEELSEIGNLGVEIGGEALETALESLHETLGSQDWEKHFERLKVIDIDRIEERMERVQERLERLEKRLEREYGRDLERAERDLERAERARERAREQREKAEEEREKAEEKRERAEREGDGLL